MDISEQDNYMDCDNVADTTALVEALHGTDFDVAGKAALALAQINDSAVVENLLECYTRNHRRLRRYKIQKERRYSSLLKLQAHICTALQQLGDVAVPGIVLRLQEHHNLEYYKQLVHILGGISTIKAVVPLIGMAGYYDQIPEALLLEVLHSLGNCHHPQSLPVLQKILWNDTVSSAVQQSAIKAISLIDGDVALQELLRCLDHDQAMVRFYSVVALEKRGFTDAAVLILSLLDDPNSTVAAQAGKTLLQFAGAALPLLLERIARGDDFSGNCANTVRRIAKQAMDNLQEGYGDSGEHCAVLTRLVEFALQRHQ